jgi:hypothetical protein
VADLDCGQGALDDGAVVPGPAAGDEEAEGLAHGWVVGIGGEVPHPIAARTPEGGGTVNRTARRRVDRPAARRHDPKRVGHPRPAVERQGESG